MRNLSPLNPLLKQGSLQQTIHDLFPQAGQFSRVRSESRKLDEFIWDAMCKWHSDSPDFFDDGYVDKSEVHSAIKHICATYGAAHAEESVLTILYLKYRSRFMSTEWNFRVYHDNYFVRDHDYFEEEIDEHATGLGYPNSAANTGDIVDIQAIDVSKVGCSKSYPLAQAWPKLLEDARFSLGLIQYRRPLEHIEVGLRDQLKRKKINEAKVIKNLAGWADLHLKDQSNLLPLIAMAGHTLIMRQL